MSRSSISLRVLRDMTSASLPESEGGGREECSTFNAEESLSRALRRVLASANVKVKNLYILVLNAFRVLWTCRAMMAVSLIAEGRVRRPRSQI